MTAFKFKSILTWFVPICLAVILVLICQISSSEAATTTYSGIYDGVHWRITSDDELIIGVEGQEELFSDNNSRDQNSWPWKNYSGIKKVTVAGTVIGKGSFAHMFSNLGAVEAIDVSGLDTSAVTDMYGMFYMCSSLQSLDLSAFDTTNVTRMGLMFSQCTSLKYIYFSNNNASEVKNMDQMFFGCLSLESLDLSSFNTAKVESMWRMFCGCRALSNLNVSNMKTSKVTNMQEMFSGCRSLGSLDLKSFVTSKVTNMNKMFYDCSSLGSLDLSNFDTRATQSMAEMFSDCNLLESLNVSSFNTWKVTTMSNMFSGCNSLKSLNLSKFDTTAVTDMSYIFYECNALENIALGSTSIFNETPPAATWQRYQTLEGDSVNIPVIDSISDYAGDYPGWYSTCTYEVTYNANGGTNAPQGQLKARGVDLKLTSSIPTRTGYTFSGWAETGDATAAAYQPGSLYKSDEATRFYAVWKKNQNSTTKPISITSAAVRTSVVYTGALRKPAVTVKAGSTVLKNGTDYTLTYTDNRNVGTAKVTVKGKGKYTGTLTKTFRITPYKLKAANVTVKKQATYTGKAIKPKVTVKAGETALKKGRDYTVTYTGNKNVGTATATVKGKGNYAAKISKTFRILPPKLTGNVKTGKVRGGKTQIDITLKSKPKCKVTEYVVQISASKKFPKGRIVVKPKLNSKKQLRMYGKLKKGKTFYIRVRIETKVKGKTYAGPWSNTMKFKGR